MTDATPSSYPWMRYASAEDIVNLDNALGQLTFNTWSALGHADKYGRPIVIIGHQPEGYRQRTEHLLGVVFIGPQALENSRVARQHLEQLCEQRTGQKGTTWLPKPKH